MCMYMCMSADFEVGFFFSFFNLFLMVVFKPQPQQDDRCDNRAHDASCCCAQRTPFHSQRGCSGRASRPCGCGSGCAGWRAAKKPCGRCGRCSGHGSAGKGSSWREGSSGGVARQE